jgi:hypothetical protein
VPGSRMASWSSERRQPRERDAQPQ